MSMLRVSDGRRVGQSLAGATLGAIAVALLCQQPVMAGPCTITPSPAWKNAINTPNDAYRYNTGNPQSPSWVKFTVLTCDPGTVYYQDSFQYEFHYDFAVNELDPFLGLSLEEFNARTLYTDAREAVLGAVVLPPLAQIFPPEIQIREYGIQLIGQDPFTPQEVVDLFNTVRATVDPGPQGADVFYFPTYEQLASAQANEAFLASNGIEISSPARWTSGNVCYSQGWTIGRLTFMPAGDIEDAFLDGTLKSDDILLTDGIPASIPLVAGVLTTAPATPNSHVVILASTFQVPFAFLVDPADVQLAQDLVGRKVALRAIDTGFVTIDGGCDVRLIDVQDRLTAQQIDELLAYADPGPLAIDAIEPLGALGSNTDVLSPADMKHFGGKSSNFGFLRRAIPNDSPLALGISFDLWTAFLDQVMPGGLTLRQEIENTLAMYPDYPPPDLDAFADDMDDIRDRIRDDTVFTPAQEAAIITLLQDPQYGFDPLKKIRFRSSTNVEDAEQFTGAGLYDSNSGCLADDLDGDTVGPSLCDATDDNERGVFRAIRRVFRSFYNDNAVLERMRHNVDEDDVGMAILVHHSFPDEIELANGVATYKRNPPANDHITLVTQDGAVSVAEPPPGAVPEVVEVELSPSLPPFIDLAQSSNLVLLGETVMDWQTDYVELTGLLEAVADQFETETGKTQFALDYEYKKVAPGGGALPPGGLVVKQVRQLPQPDDTPSIPQFLIGEATRLVGGGGLPGRLKAIWEVDTRNLWLEPAVLATESIFGDVSLEFTDGCQGVTLAGTMSTLPGAVHTFDVGLLATTDSWSVAQIPNPRTYALTVHNLGSMSTRTEGPIVTLDDLTFGYGLSVQIDHTDPVPRFPGSSDMRTTEFVSLRQVADDWEDTPSFERPLEPENAPVVVHTHYSVLPQGPICAGCHSVLDRFGETTITGLTSVPIVLRSQFSQTYASSNHNFFEMFQFEPFLEPGISSQVLAELDAMDIRLIQINIDNISTPPGLRGLGDGIVTIEYFNDDDVGGMCVPPEPDLAADFAGCLTGPLAQEAPATCHPTVFFVLDHDADGDVDLDDFAAAVASAG